MMGKRQNSKVSFDTGNTQSCKDDKDVVVSSPVKKAAHFVNPITQRKERRKEKRQLKKSKRFAFSQGKEVINHC